MSSIWEHAISNCCFETQSTVWMFNCKYVENTPNTKRLLTHRIQLTSSSILASFSIRLSPCYLKQRQSRAIGKSEVGSRKLEVGSWKAEVWSRKTLLGFRTSVWLFERTILFYKPLDLIGDACFCKFVFSSSVALWRTNFFFFFYLFQAAMSTMGLKWNSRVSKLS